MMSQSNLADLVIAEELELIICGSSVSPQPGCTKGSLSVLYVTYVFFLQEWDIDALEESTRYDGFTPKQPVVVYVTVICLSIQWNLSFKIRQCIILLLLLLPLLLLLLLLFCCCYYYCIYFLGISGRLCGSFLSLRGNAC